MAAILRALKGSTKYEPSPRYAHYAVSVRGRLYAWGGGTQDFSESARQKLKSVVETFDPYMEVWQQRGTSGSPPPGVYSGGCAAIGDSMYVSCGYDGNNRQSALHEFDTTTLQWRDRTAPEGPMRKVGCRMISYDGDKLALFGGIGYPTGPIQPGSKFIKYAGSTDGSGWTNEFHLFHTREGIWSSPPTTGDRPPPCTHFSFTAIDPHRAVLFGGYQPEHGRVNDAYILDLREMRWTRIPNTGGGPWPVGRSSHAACCINYGEQHPQLLVTGGRDNDNKTLRDAWLLDVDSGTWKEIPLPDDVQPRCYHTITAFSLGPGLTEATTFGGCPDFAAGKTDDDTPKLSKTTVLQLESVEVPSSGGVSREWVLVSVGTKRQLGSQKRLREKHRKIGQHSTPSNTERATAEIEGAKRVGDTSPESRILRERITVLERRVQEAKRRSEEAERGRQEAVIGRQEAEGRAQDTHQREQEVERGRQEAEERAKEAERGRQEAEGRAQNADQRSRESEQGRQEAEMRAQEGERVRQEAEERAKEADRVRQEAEERAQVAEQGRQEAEERAQNSNKRAQESELGRQEAEERAQNANRRAQESELGRKEAEERAQNANRRAQESELGRKEAEERAQEAERKRQEAEERAKEAEWMRQEAEGRAQNSNQRSQESEHGRQEAEMRAQEGERVRQKAEVRAQEAERMRQEAERMRQEAEETSQGSEGRAMDASRRAQEAEKGRERAEQGRQETEKRAQQFEERTFEAEERVLDVLKTVRNLETQLRDSELERQDAERTTEEMEQRAQEAEREKEEADQRAQGAEREKEEADRRAQVAEREKEEADRRAQVAEREKEEAEWRAQEAEREKEEADQRAQNAEREKEEAERRAQEAEREKEEAEQRAQEAEREKEVAEERAQEAEREKEVAEERAAETRRRQEEEQSFWVVERDEIQMTGRELGEGGWATVKVAMFRGSRVAAKCLHKIIINPYNRHLFTREMNIAARIRHPNLLQFIGATLLGELIVLTELMTTSLRAVLEQRPLNPPQITSISLDIARALNYLHLMRPDPIIHRDISSANVLLDPAPNNTWRAKVSDYGSANLLQQLKTVGPGNPNYSAPEAYIPPQQSPKMDIFSFGVLLLEMYSNEFPDSASRERLLQTVRDRRLVDLIRQCTAEDIDTRPTASDILRHLT